MNDSARNSTALRAPVVSVQIPLPVLEYLRTAQGDLFALFVDTDREVLRAMMEQDRVAVCGPKGKRLPERAAVRAASRKTSSAAKTARTEFLIRSPLMRGRVRARRLARAGGARGSLERCGVAPVVVPVTVG